METYEGFRISMASSTVKVASSMNVSAIFEGDSDVEGFALMFDAMLLSTYFKVKTLDSGYQFVERKGTGIRIALRVTNITAKMNLNFGAVLAQSRLGHASTQYDIKGVGLSNDVINALFNIDQTGELDSESYLAMTDALTISFPKYLDPEDGAHVPVTEKLGLGKFSTPYKSIETDPREQARAINYAMSLVSRGTPLSQALRDKPSWLNEAALAFAYSKAAKNQAIAPDDPLPSAMVARASNWLARGALE